MLLLLLLLLLVLLLLVVLVLVLLFWFLFLFLFRQAHQIQPEWKAAAPAHQMSNTFLRNSTLTAQKSKLLMAKVWSNPQRPNPWLVAEPAQIKRSTWSNIFDLPSRGYSDHMWHLNPSTKPEGTLLATINGMCQTFDQLLVNCSYSAIRPVPKPSGTMTVAVPHLRHHDQLDLAWKSVTMLPASFSSLSRCVFAGLFLRILLLL